MKQYGWMSFVWVAVLAAPSVGSGHDHAGAHAADETRQIRSARTLQKAGAHGYTRDACPFVSYVAEPPPPGKVVLTFDDGPSPELTSWIMNVLAQRHVKATFFLLGSRVELYPELAKQIRRAGHLIGNHSWEHPNFHDIEFITQIRTISQADGLLGGFLRPTKLFRYPYGNASCPSNDFLREIGYRIVGWHADSCDWAYDRTGSVGDADAKLCDVADGDREDFVAHAIHAVEQRRGGILLMHEIHHNTIKRLPEIVDGLLKAGFRFTNLDDPELRPALK